MTTLEIVATVLTAMVVLIAIVGGLDVLRRLRAQDRLRQELLRLQTEIAEGPSDQAHPPGTAPEDADPPTGSEARTGGGAP